jgi:hypothetical protein
MLKEYANPLFISAALSIWLAVSAAIAEPWPQLPDGRTVIDMKGIKIAVPSQGPDNAGFVRFGINYGMRDGVDFRLPEVLAQPDRIQQSFSQGRSAYFLADNAPLQPGLFLGRFERAEPMRLSISTGTDQRGRQIGVSGCQDWQATSNKYHASAITERLAADQSGWIRQTQPRSPADAIFIKFIDDHSRGQSKYIAFACGAVLGDCKKHICLQDMLISFDFNGLTAGKVRYSQPFATAKFDSTIARAVEALQYLLIDKKIDVETLP